jgi:hypothetical protein
MRPGSVALTLDVTAPTDTDGAVAELFGGAE